MARPRRNPVELTAIAETILALRKELGLSQQAFSDVLGVSLGSVARYELGRRPEASYLSRLAQLALKVDRPDLANVFWNAYADDIGVTPDGFEQLRRACQHEAPILNAIARIRSRTEDEQIHEAADEVVARCELVMNAIESVLPVKVVKRQHSDGRVETGKAVDAAAIKSRAKKGKP